MPFTTSGKYEPVMLPDEEAPTLSRAIQDELREIANALQNQKQEMLFLDELNTVPMRLIEGMVVRADGTNWNPGSGRGVYCYQGGAWTLLG